MRFLHTADLHLGKVLNDVSLLPDQAYILDQILSAAQREKVDAVLIAGDIYQRSAPQAEAVALFDRFITQLAGLGLPAFVISGNHDSAARVSYFSSLVKSAGIYISERFDGMLQHVSLQDAYGPLTVWMLPYLRPSAVRRYFPGETITNHQEAVEAILRHTPVDPAGRNILLAHEFITGSETSDSEEPIVGGLDGIAASVFDCFDYAALGHIHKPQKIRRESLRYAGSPLKYSFSEAAYPKSVSIADVREKGTVAVRTVALSPLRDLRLIEGLMSELMAMDYSEDYLWVTVRDELVPPDAGVRLSVNFPNMMRLSVVNSRTKQDLDITAAENIENKTVTELFSDFYRLQNNGQAPGPAHRKEMEKILEKIEEAKYETN